MNILPTFLSCVMVLNGLLAFGQNVGIGTAFPISPLHVFSSTNNDLLRLEGPGSIFVSLYESGTYRGYFGSFSGSAQDVDFGTGSGNAAGKVHLTIQASPKLTIAANGSVGTGTTSPASVLHVNGQVSITGSN